MVTCKSVASMGRQPAARQAAYSASKETKHNQNLLNSQQRLGTAQAKQQSAGRHSLELQRPKSKQQEKRKCLEIFSLVSVNKQTNQPNRYPMASLIQPNVAKKKHVYFNLNSLKAMQGFLRMSEVQKTTQISVHFHSLTEKLHFQGRQGLLCFHLNSEGDLSNQT